MESKITIELGDVQKTLLLPMWGRAIESQKTHPRLVDRTAVEIMRRVDYDFSGMAGKLSELTQIAWIMRSALVDEVVARFLRQYPNGTIVNIGCGMDTTFDRVDNGSVTWYDLDLPDVIELRRKFLSETERRRFIAASVLESRWMGILKVTQQVLFVAAGVFYYFKEEQIKEFLKRQADMFPGSQLFMDVSSPYGVRVANKMVIRRSGLDEKSFLRWGLESQKVFSSWDDRFEVLDTYFYFGRRGRGLSLKNRLLGLVSDCLKIQYMILLQMKK